MFELTTLTELDQQRKELLITIKKIIYHYFHENHIHGVTVNVQNNIITLTSATILDEDTITKFCEDFQLTLSDKKILEIINYPNNTHIKNIKYIFINE